MEILRDEGELEILRDEDEGQMAISERQVKEGLTEKKRFGQTLERSVRGFTQQVYKEENSKE